MSIDYSLLGGAESPFPPPTTPTRPTLPTRASSSHSSFFGNNSSKSFFNYPSQTRPNAQQLLFDRGIKGVERATLSPPQFQSKTNSEVSSRESSPGSGGSIKLDESLSILTEAGPEAASQALEKSGGQENLTKGGMPKDPEDFLWMLTEEPHRSRRRAILKAHPEVRKLMGHTRTTFPLVILVVTIQILSSVLLRNTSPFSPLFLLTSYIIGGTANQNIFLSIHEITHNLAFKRLLPNKLLAMVANVPIGVPYAMAFKGYHIEHHKYLGEEGIDTDLPSRFEAVVLNNVAGKTFFATFQILFYALRPGFIRSQKPTLFHAYNILFILLTDFLLVHFTQSWYPLIYLLFSSFFAGSLHPCAAHFIAEHYLMNEDEAVVQGQERKVGQMEVKRGGEDLEGIRELSQETASYYGWLNVLCYNVGYHNEHHDFPSIPWTRLPKLHAIAHEFYDPLPSHPSWPAVTWKFITDPKVGMWSRAKRESGNKGTKIADETWEVCESEKVGSKGADEKTVELEEMMAEAVERGYGSDVEDKKKR